METLQVLKCQMCGGALKALDEKRYQCAYCGEIFEVKEELTNDDIINLNRAETERRRFKFDDALDSYEEVLENNPRNEVALWGAFLSEYGVEYVKDYDDSYKPTCHRASEKPVTASRYYPRLPESYRQKAEAIEEIRKEILSQMRGLDKYDVFICYKSKGADGRTPTKEAKWGYSLYNNLYRERPNLRVFFADETLSGHNARYESQIFNALKTAKLMIVLASTLENVTAPWVKNEWKRFFEMSKTEKDKVIRVVYQDIEPYEFPRELQTSQMIDNDAGKTIADIFKAVDELFPPKTESKPIAPTVTPSAPEKPAPVVEKPVATTPVKPTPVPAKPVETPTQALPRKEVVLNTVRYVLKGKEYVVENTTFAEGNIVIEGEIDGLPVTRIEKEAFKGAKRLTGVTISKGVTRIEESAFWACPALKSVVLSDCVTQIGDFAFSNCAALEKVRLGNGVKSIGKFAFSGCALTKIRLPDSLTDMGDGVFDKCKNLAEVDLGNGVTRIGERSFTGCRVLASIKIPDSVVSIGKAAFTGCNLTSVTLGNGVTEIGEDAFRACNFDKIILPDSLKTIGVNAFFCVRSLQEVRFGKALENIGDCAFQSCSALTDIRIPKSVKKMGVRAFAECENLTSVAFENPNGWSVKVEGGKEKVISPKVMMNAEKMAKLVTKKWVANRLVNNS